MSDILLLRSYEAEKSAVEAELDMWLERARMDPRPQTDAVVATLDSGKVVVLIPLTKVEQASTEWDPNLNLKASLLLEMK